MQPTPSMSNSEVGKNLGHSGQEGFVTILFLMTSGHAFPVPNFSGKGHWKLRSQTETLTKKNLSHPTCSHYMGETHLRIPSNDWLAMAMFRGDGPMYIAETTDVITQKFREDGTNK